MSATDDLEAETERKIGLVREYLVDRVERRGELYLKSREIAAAVEAELSAKQVGQFMGTLADRPVDPEIERWAYTGGTTWRVRRS
ncbi:hypothetical protein BRC62_04255 [Halobacteriales archaeon QH_10_67_13]|nr:MAG: hypothetical protein BRC62_04255 [Halobacteriales archaeon QH_10_67_13]